MPATPAVFGLPSSQGAVEDVSVNFIIDGGGSTITTGSKGFLFFDYAVTIVANTVLADQSGSIALDLKTCTYAAFPTDSSIVASAPPTISSAQKSQDTALAGWTKRIAAGTVVEVIVTSAASVQRVTLCLKVRRT